MTRSIRFSSARPDTHPGVTVDRQVTTEAQSGVSHRVRFAVSHAVWRLGLYVLLAPIASEFFDF